MGIFSGSTKILVSSSVYNLAGDIKERPDYLKTSVIGAVLSSNQYSAGELIPRSYLNGPGIRMRNFSYWARTNYEPTVGIAYGDITTTGVIDNDAIASQIPHGNHEEVIIQNAEIGFADFSFWADQYVLENFPGSVSGTWKSDMLDDGRIQVEITGRPPIRFTPVGFDHTEQYLYIPYSVRPEPEILSTNPGSNIPLLPGEPFPSTTGWSHESTTDAPIDVHLSTTVVTKKEFSDGRPDETTTVVTPRDEVVIDHQSRWGRTETLGVSGDAGSIRYRDYDMFFYQVLGPIEDEVSVETSSETVGGVTIDTTITTTKQVQTMLRSYRISNTEFRRYLGGKLRIMIYRRGSGNSVLDSLFNNEDSGDKFYPYIPIRLDGDWVTGSLNTLTTKAFRKATGGKLSKVVKSLKDNDDIDDIQFIYTVFGASFNSPENTAKEYIFRFFQQMMISYPPSPSFPTFQHWKAAFNEEVQKEVAWIQWYNDQQHNGPTFGDPEPPMPNYPVEPTKSFRIRSTTEMEYDMEIKWSYLEGTINTGKAWPGAKPGELRFINNGTESFPFTRKEVDDSGMLKLYAASYKVDNVSMIWQRSANEWRVINIIGGVHKNRVYKGKFVEITTIDALNDAEESGFVLPLHNTILRSMPLVRSTQLCTASNYLVLNCYQEVKQKWYQTSVFQVVLVVVIVVVSVMFPQAAGAGGGLLGSNAAVGAALGFAAGTAAAALVGAIANAIAAMVLMSVIQKGATMLFGDKLGLIIGTIAGMMAMQVGTALSNGQSMSTMMGQMMRADNLLRLTSTMGNAVSQYINNSTQELLRKTESMMQAYNEEMTSLQRQYELEFGYNQGTVNPLGFTDAFALASEPRDTFLARTLMTGSDIADMSMKMITNFTDANLQLDFV
ncbi:hypothetical protein JJJA_0068 [Achromobacter phage JWDelta]|uniref:Uncharacterized protein n=1 Tax=Achromobacter phage JWDelta TaxID=1416008 RepID=V9SHQ9_9CAUD|nr:hypothetical protein JJJA_0068 [Achromobacter phage JWDelta]